MKLQLAGLDVSRETVAKVESRLIRVTDHQMLYYAKVFKVGLMELFPSIDIQDQNLHETLLFHMKAKM